jgi:hypothetical protein
MLRGLKTRAVNLRGYILVNRITFLLLFMLLLTSFAYREPKYCKMVNGITRSYLSDFAEPRGLKLTGYGGAMMGDIQSITLRFSSFDALNVEAARKLYVEIMDTYLQCINAHEKIRPHLHNFPFDIDNIKLSIAFVGPQGLRRKDGHVALMFIGRNHTLYYDAYDPVAQDFYTLEEETYEEARRKVTGQ